MARKKEQKEQWAPSRPETVGELIALLELFPKDWPISFGPFTLFRLKDRGDLVHFEMNEAMGVDYEMKVEPHWD